MTDTWYILHDDYTGHNGRTHRVFEGVLQCWSGNRTWIPSAFGSIDRLKSYARNNNCNAAVYVTKPRRKVTS